MILSKRLEACLTYTEGFMHLADIGTDHAMLPIEAVLRGHVVDAIAIDNKFGPYLQGRNNVKKHDLEGRVKMSLGDGLEKIMDETDVVVISGLGGELMRQILVEGPHRNVKRFILQPNRDIQLIRREMMSLQYRIIDELVLHENDKYYDIIICEPGQSSYTELELRYGPINLVLKPYHFVERLKSQITRNRELLQQVSNQERASELQREVLEMEEILNESN